MSHRWPLQLDSCIVNYAKISRESMQSLSKKLVDAQTDRVIGRVQSDPGDGYLDNDLRNHLSTRITKHSPSTAYSLHQKGAAERENRMLLNLVRAMVGRYRIMKFIWTKALCTPFQIRNKITTASCGKKRTCIMFGKDNCHISHISTCWCQDLGKSLQGSLWES